MTGSINTNIIYNMKTIAITVDDETIELIDELFRSTNEFRSRSALMRTALREYAAQVRKRKQEERETAVIQKHKKELDKQLEVLISEQAR